MKSSHCNNNNNHDNNNNDNNDNDNMFQNVKCNVVYRVCYNGQFTRENDDDKIDCYQMINNCCCNLLWYWNDRKSQIDNYIMGKVSQQYASSVVGCLR